MENLTLTFLKDLFNLEYKASLTEKYQHKYYHLKDEKFLNLKDVDRSLFVKVFDQFSARTRRETFHQVKSIRQELVSNLKLDRPTLILVFLGTYNPKDHSLFLKEFPDDELIEMVVFNQNSIRKLSQRHGLKQKDITKPMTDEVEFDEKPEVHISDEKEEGIKDLELLKINNPLNKPRNFWVGGHFWGKENDKRDFFLNKNIWVNGHSEKNTNAVKKAKIGDVVFLKSTFAKKGTSFLRVKAIGVVSDNLGDGQNLKVNWYELENDIDVPGLGQYRRSFQQIKEGYIDRALERLLKDQPNILSVIDNLIANNVHNKFKEEEELLDDDGNPVLSEKGEILSLGLQKEVKGENSSTVASDDGDEESFQVTTEDGTPIKSESGENQVTEDYIEGKPDNESSIFDDRNHENEETIAEYSGQKQKVTVLDNDSNLKGKDLLGIDKDVKAFALILASKEVKPPIAIALFGRWGSGKSFFMEKLSERVNELMVNQGFLVKKEELKGHILEDKSIYGGKFCKGIAQIKFNAWSYLDANLWAGMISSIFEKLDEFITKEGRGDKEKIEIRNKLSEKLQILSLEKNITEEEKEKLEGERKKSKEALITLNEERDSLYDKAAKKTLDDLINEVKKKVKLEDTLKNRILDYGISQKEIISLNPNALYDEVRSWRTFFKNMGKMSPLWFVIFTLCTLISLTIFFNPYDVLNNIDLFRNKLLDEMVALALLFSPFIKKWMNAYTALRKVVPPINEYRNKFNRALDNEKFEHDKSINLLQVQVSELDLTIAAKETQIAELTSQIEEVDYTLNHVVAQRAFNDFIGRRTQEDHYKEHLGIISIIRRDFEVLSDLFHEIQLGENPSPELIKKKKDQEDMKELFKDDQFLDRIILYIDDLDRCSDAKVLEVIQAVHLLMAFPLFNVVVGVDKRCVHNALTYKNLLQYQQFASGKEPEDYGIDVISPNEYLEKIFQIPFQLKNPGEEAVENMIEGVLKVEKTKPEVTGAKSSFSKKLDFTFNADNLEATNRLESIDYQKHFEESTLYLSNREEERSDDPRSISKASNSEKKVYDEVEETVADEKKEEEDVLTPTKLSVDEGELENMKALAWLIGDNPRAIKRFINVYRIVRAHEAIEVKNGDVQSTYLKFMFLLALPSGEYKKYYLEFRKRMQMEEFQEKSLKEILEPKLFLSIDSNDIDKNKGALEELEGLQNKLQLKLESNYKFKTLLNEPFNLTSLHFIQRFTFSEIN